LCTPPPLVEKGRFSCGKAHAKILLLYWRCAITKAELAHEVADNSDLTQQQAEVVVQEVLDSIIEALQSGDRVELRGFGSFRMKERKARVGRIPKTGESVEVPAKKVAHFRLSKGLKELINS